MSIFDLLRKREADRELSAAEFIRECVTAEATGKAGKIDIGKLEGHMRAAGWTLSQFEQAVERKREVDRLRKVVADKGKASATFQAASKHAAEVRTAHEAEIKRLQCEIADADQAKEEARRAVDVISSAEQSLRQLRSDDERRQLSDIKQRGSILRDRKQHLEQVVRAAERDLQDGGVRTSQTDRRRKELVAEQKQILTDAQSQLATIGPEITRVDEQLAQADAELVGA